MFFGFIPDVAQLSAACLKASLCSSIGLAFLTFAISAFMNTLYAESLRGCFSLFSLCIFEDLAMGEGVKCWWCLVLGV